MAEIWRRWRIPILLCAEHGPCSFAELWSLLPGIAPRDLNDALLDLTNAGMLERTNSVYALTEKGIAAVPILRRIEERFAAHLWSEAAPADFAAIELLYDRPRATPPEPTGSQSVENSIRQMIESGLLRPDERVPSIRKMAAALALSPTIVERAYQRLIRAGLLTGRPRSGTFVSQADAQAAVEQSAPARSV